MKMMQDEIRKGPWTEHEDILLVNFVHLFGDRRWDFIAKVSGLKVLCGGRHKDRTGKSCRLRWVNYLHPGLKRGKMTPQEERLVLELHAKWGNRWSRIARKLPGRTDNEIKNYWRTHMRKKAQEKKRANSPPSSSSSSNFQYSSSSTTSTTVNSMPFSGTGKVSFYDTGGPTMAAAAALVEKNNNSPELEDDQKGCYYSMDDIWKDIDLSEENTIKPLSDLSEEDTIKPLSDLSEEGCNFSSPSLMASLSWEYCWDSVDSVLWKMDNEEESKMLLPINNPFLSSYEYGRAASNLTG